jgi:hypothetical protein
MPTSYKYDERRRDERIDRVGVVARLLSIRRYPRGKNNPDEPRTHAKRTDVTHSPTDAPVDRKYR